MGKNKNKHKQNQPGHQQKPVQQIKPVLTDEVKSEIELKHQKTQNVDSVDQLSPESENKLKEAEAKDDVTKYWNFVKDLNRRAETLIFKAEEELQKSVKLNEDTETSRKEADLLKVECKKKLEDYNKKAKELLERELAIDNGEYTGVIKHLLDTFKESEKKVFYETENLIKELTEFHSKNLLEFSDFIDKQHEFENQQANLNRDKKRFEIEKKIFEEDLREEYEIKYSEQFKLKTTEFERLSSRLVRLEEENEKLNQLFENFENSFESLKPEEILMRFSFLNKEFENLKMELNERPDKFELETKQKQIDELYAKVEEYKEKINEGELLELKRILSNMDTYVIEINEYKSRIESAGVREATLKRNIADLQSTIDQLKGESTQKEDAFEFAKRWDADSRDIGYNHLDKKRETPSTLSDMVQYVQQWMAYKSDKPFYYSTDTLKIFLAGLNMSPISILQGISGTGKTSLPREFAKALISDGYYQGIDAENQIKASYRICAVQSGWRDNMDLMGYYNSFEHKYKETDFFKALYLANQPKYSDTLFLIILDEMNLSRPEHYFADFLSLLEQSINERYINLSNTPEEVLPASIKGGKLRIPENVRFIGTANHDETTLEFAPKTYDRSNVMEMPKNHPGKPGNDKLNNSFNITYSWLSSKFTEAESKHKDSLTRFHEFLNSDDIKLMLMDKGIGIGNRLEFQAEKFISVFIESGKEKDKDIAKASDHLITSRLFRNLKNRYDLDKNNLTKFKEDYIKYFEKSFKQRPEFASDLLNNEISKK